MLLKKETFDVKKTGHFSVAFSVLFSQYSLYRHKHIWHFDSHLTNALIQNNVRQFFVVVKKTSSQKLLSSTKEASRPPGSYQITHKTSF